MKSECNNQGSQATGARLVAAYPTMLAFTRGGSRRLMSLCWDCKDGGWVAAAAEVGEHRVGGKAWQCTQTRSNHKPQLRLKA